MRFRSFRHAEHAAEQRSVPAISVVVPVRNEAGNIAPLVAEIAAALQGTGRAFEIVYVNDGSRDATEAGIARLDGGAPVAAADPP